jgi:hypothetical protein
MWRKNVSLMFFSYKLHTELTCIKGKSLEKAIDLLFRRIQHRAGRR